MTSVRTSFHGVRPQSCRVGLKVAPRWLIARWIITRPGNRPPLELTWYDEDLKEMSVPKGCSSPQTKVSHLFKTWHNSELWNVVGSTALDPGNPGKPGVGALVNDSEGKRTRPRDEAGVLPGCRGAHGIHGTRTASRYQPPATEEAFIGARKANRAQLPTTISMAVRRLGSMPPNHLMNGRR